MKRAVLLLAVVMAAFVAEAQTRTVALRWEYPTENEDGTPLEDLRGFRIYRFDDVGMSNPVMIMEIDEVPLDQATYTQGNVGITAPAYLAVTAYDEFLNESEYSNVLTLDGVGPKPPGNLTVTIEINVSTN